MDFPKLSREQSQGSPSPLRALHARPERTECIGERALLLDESALGGRTQCRNSLALDHYGVIPEDARGVHRHHVDVDGDADEVHCNASFRPFARNGLRMAMMHRQHYQYE
jgi:hypothetical protein